MKYTIPKINTSLLMKAAEIFNSGIGEYKGRLLKKEGTLLESIFSILRRFFSTLGAPMLSTKLRVKEDSPRTSPLSSEYNRFVRALSLDTTNSYEDQNSIATAVMSHYNYSQSNRGMYGGILKEVNRRLTDFAIISQAVDTKDIWFKESFNTEEYIEPNGEQYTIVEGRVDTERGIYKLDSTQSDDVLTPGNISDIDDSQVQRDPTFTHSPPYYGSKYGIHDMNEFTVGSSDEVREEIDPGSSWNSKATRYLVDPDEVDTFWEVEVVAREEMKDLPTRSRKGPYNFLEQARERGRLQVQDGDSRVYTYVNSEGDTGGSMVYDRRSYPGSFFYDDDGRAIQRYLKATLEIHLKEPQYVDAITLTRKGDIRDTIAGTSSDIYVEDIQTLDEAGEWISITTAPTGYRTSNATVIRDRITKVGESGTSTPRTPTRRVKAVGQSPGVVRERISELAQEKMPRRERGATTPRTGGTPSPRPTVPRTPLPPITILRPSSSQFSRGDSWTFDTRVTTAIKIILYTEYPRKFRYSMGKHMVVREARVGLVRDDEISWMFVQYPGGTINAEEEPGYWSEEGKWIASGAGLIGAGLLLGPTGGLITGAVLAVVHLIGWLGGYKDPIVMEVPEEILTMQESIYSDMYRWSIAISDVSATTSNYLDEGELLSTTFVSPQAIDRIMFYTNHELNGGAIEYYVVLDDGAAVRVQPWEELDAKFEDGRYVPKILYVNSDLPEDRRERTKWGANAYIDVPHGLHRIRLRAIMSRGESVHETPKIYDYKIRIIPKEVGGEVSHVE